MMYLKAKFKTHTIGSTTRYIYPPVWNSQRIDVLAYEEPERPGGEKEEFCVICVEDDYGKELEKDPSFQKITKGEAERLAKEWRRPSPATSSDIDILIERLDEKTMKELVVKLCKKLGI